MQRTTLRRMTHILKGMAICFLVFSANAPLNAATFVVNSFNDSHDANLSDGICEDPEGKCTLRAAIEQASYLGKTPLSDPHIIDLSQVRSDIKLHLGEMPPFPHVKLVSEKSPTKQMYSKKFVDLHHKFQQLIQEREVSATATATPLSSGRTTLDLRQFNSDNLSITILDDTGEEMEYINLEGMRNIKLELDLSRYKVGTYLIKVAQGSKDALLKRFVVAR